MTNKIHESKVLKYFVVMIFTAFIIHFQLVESAYADPFEQGNLRVSISGGSARAYDDDYVVIGAGVGYYFRDGLETGLDFDAWLNGDRDIYSISPQIRYVFYQVPKVKPYAGAFYRHTFVEKRDDIDEIGLRAGVNFMMGSSSYLGVGAVYDSIVDCDPDDHSSCSDFYPEVVLSVSF
jgi:hypothetical protein